MDRKTARKSCDFVDIGSILYIIGILTVSVQSNTKPEIGSADRAWMVSAL